jgi:hypothetical protein
MRIPDTGESRDTGETSDAVARPDAAARADAVARPDAPETPGAGKASAPASGGRRNWQGRGRGLAVRNADALIFAADMYGLQLDQLAVLTGGARAARAAAERWRELGYADTARLTEGPAWLWVTKAGLAACGRAYSPSRPALSTLAHIRAVAAARLALEATAAYRAAAAYWRCERRIRSTHGVGVRQHLPDGEVHWPDGAHGPDQATVPWAGECWAVEAELTSKTVARTTAIMREILARTGDYGCPAAEATVPGRPPRHSRVLYLCSPAALANVLRARESLGPLAPRVEVRDLPPGAPLPP